MTDLVVSNGAEYRQSTDAAGLCKEIVVATASKIGGKSYVGVEGWQAIAVAHGCAASADNVERVNDEGMSGFKAVGIVRRMSDGVEIARAEGFLGDDEATWSKRPVYARRAMVQTRAISRACRSAFAHVVVMMKANLSTTPAEEVPQGGFNEAPAIEHRVVRHEPETPRAAPVKLAGPYTSKSALWAAVRAFDRELRACHDLDDLNTFLLTTDATELLAQVDRDAPQLAEGGEGLPPEFEPLNLLIIRLREEMQVADANRLVRD